MILKHHREPVPDIRQFAADVSDAAWQLIQRCMSKAPEARYRDAAAVLDDLERLRRGEPTSVAVHPRLPPHDPKKVVQYDWVWRLEATPLQLWPYVSNTDRVNRAAGMSAVRFTNTSEETRLGKRVRRHGAFRRAGVSVAWEEHPFEWIEGRRFGVLRQDSSGPFKWFVSLVELEPLSGGETLLTHRLRIEPHGMLGRTVAAVEIGLKSKGVVERLYRRIDEFVTSKLKSDQVPDPFEPALELTPARRQRLAHAIERISSHAIDPTVVDKLADFIAHASAQAVARIRPIALARRLGVPADAW